MSVTEFLSKIKLDGKPIDGVVQITADAEKASIWWNVPRDGAEPARRAITVESEAVTIG